MIKFFKKYHRWIGIVLVILMILFSISGIVMNHRYTFSGMSVPRNLLPHEYVYKDWNLAAIRSSEKIGSDSILLYGNIGIWLTNESGGFFQDYNQGFRAGIDNRKIFKVLHFNDSTTLAGTLFGLFSFSQHEHQWNKIVIPGKNENVVDLLQKNDSLFVLTRSELFVTTDLLHFEPITLPAAAGYDNKVSLFKTLWVVHSGAIYGRVGILVVDFVALIFIFLSVTGFIMFISKRKLKQKHLAKSSKKIYKHQFKWNHQWHKRSGWITVILLFITVATGIFLRPPLLIPIAPVRVDKIPYTEMDTPNPWYDMLRRIIYLENTKSYVIATLDGFYYSDDNFNSIQAFDSQPPASVMGVNVLEEKGEDTLWIGSFEGLFSWNYKTGEVYDLIDKKVWVKPIRHGPPVGDHKVAGYSNDFGSTPILFDYDKGTSSPFNTSVFPAMTEEIIQATPMSLWNFSQEVHTGRIYRFFMGGFYILVVPLTGLLTLFMLVSGLIIWYRHHKKQKSKSSK